MGRGGEKGSRGPELAGTCGADDLGGGEGHAAGAGRFGRRLPAGPGGRTSLPFLGSSAPCEHSHPEASTLVVILRLLIFPSI